MEHVPIGEQSLSTYGPFVDEQQRRKIDEATNALSDVRVAHVNSTASGGGVAEILGSLVPLTNGVGVEADWLVMDASEEFFDVTKAIHNGLQGEEAEFEVEMRNLYRDVTVDNAEMLDDAYDAIVLHDPQSLGMAPTLAERYPDAALLWRCHIDLTAATQTFLEFVQSYLEPIDRAIFTLSSYGGGVRGVEKDVVHPAIDPFTDKNRPLNKLAGEAAAAADLEGYPFDADEPLVVQVSRFDPWKDPLGVVDAHRQVKSRIPDAQLALVGSMPDDDPEGMAIYREVAAETAEDPEVYLLTDLPDAGINALQRAADVVVQKSLREGFALTVSEALWKETPVVGSNVGGIPLQIEDDANGYLVAPDDVDATADRIVRLLEDEERRERFGQHGRETVRERFLLPRLLIDYLELFVDAIPFGKRT